MRVTQNLPVLRFDHKLSGLPFEIKPMQCDEEKTPHANGVPHSHDFFEMIWILNGTGTHRIDLLEFEVTNNQVFFVKPGQVHHLQETSPIEGYVISFAESFLHVGTYEFDVTCQSSLFRIFEKPSSIVIEREVADDMKAIAAKMTEELNNGYLFKTEILKRYFKIFLIYLIRHYEDASQCNAQTRNGELVQSFMQLIEKGFKLKKMVADYAGQLSVTPNYLNEIIKKNTGKSAGHHIRQRVVLEAKRMALYSNISMKEIAYCLGFSDSAHFSKFFKSVTGNNFSDFKKEPHGIPVAV